MRKRAYRATAVKDIKISEVIARLAEGRVCVGLDVSKAEVFAVVRDSLGRYERPWKAKQPTEVRQLVQLLGELARQRSLIVALEPTGTYGDALQRQVPGQAEDHEARSVTGAALAVLRRPAADQAIAGARLV